VRHRGSAFSSIGHRRGAGRWLAAAAGTALALALAGCAASGRPVFVPEAGVPVTMTTNDGERFSGILVSFEGGGLVVDHSIPRSEELRVVKEDGRDIAYVRGVAVGEALEIRDFDVAVRQTFDESELARTEVATRAYVGWGTAFAAVLSFFAVRVIAEDF
jgi:hypothetical protein